MFDLNSFLKDFGFPILTALVSTLVAWFLNRNKTGKETVKIEKETESVIVGNSKILIEIWSRLYEELKRKNDECDKDLAKERGLNAKLSTALEYVLHAINSSHPQIVFNARKILE